MATEPASVEYTTGTCEVWQVGHLCNHLAGDGWEPMQVWALPRDTVELPERIGDSNGPLHKALAPYMVLFRRPIPKWEDTP